MTTTDAGAQALKIGWAAHQAAAGIRANVYAQVVNQPQMSDQDNFEPDWRRIATYAETLRQNAETLSLLAERQIEQQAVEATTGHS